MRVTSNICATCCVFTLPGYTSLHRNPKGELLTNARKVHSLESDGEERLERANPDHEKHVRTAKEGSNGNAGTCTLPTEHLLRQFRGGQVEAFTKLGKWVFFVFLFFFGRGAVKSLAPHVVLNIHQWKYQ